MKTLIALVRDHSASMTSLRSGALKDYNETLKMLQQSVLDQNQDALGSVVECGSGWAAGVVLRDTNVPIQHMSSISSYKTDGSGTPLWDSVGAAINVIQSSYDYDDTSPDIAYLVMVITDGEENRSQKYNARTLAAKIKELQATDKWSFVFRVPRGYGQALMNLGIPNGNIMEWDQTEKDLIRSNEVQKQGISNYFAERAKGVTKSTSFYTDLSNVTKEDLQVALVDVSNEVEMKYVDPKDNGIQIRDFCNLYFNKFKAGHALYQLIKPETVQDYKKIFIKDKSDGKIYKGAAARQILGLPSNGDIRLIPKNHGNYDLFVQSNSVNRKVTAHTYVLYADS